MFFGSGNENATFVLEKGEESEQLIGIREDEGFYLWRGDWNSGSCVTKKEIKAFKTGDAKEVYRYSLDSGEWNLFYASE